MKLFYYLIAFVLFVSLACSPVEENPTMLESLRGELPAPTAAGLTEYAVTADTLYIRQFPSLNAPEVGVLTRGEIVNCYLSEYNEGIVWCNVGAGWASTVYLEEK